jgi:hypothetical protein
MCLCPFAIVWLKGAFWHLISSARAEHPKRRRLVSFSIWGEKWAVKLSNLSYHGIRGAYEESSWLEFARLRRAWRDIRDLRFLSVDPAGLYHNAHSARIRSRLHPASRRCWFSLFATAFGHSLDELPHPASELIIWSGVTVAYLIQSALFGALLWFSVRAWNGLRRAIHA